MTHISSIKLFNLYLHERRHYWHFDGLTFPATGRKTHTHNNSRAWFGIRPKISTTLCGGTLEYPRFIFELMPRRLESIQTEL